MIFAVHLFGYSALKTGREGRGREVSPVPVSQSSWQGKKKQLKLESKEKQSEPPSLPLFYCSTLCLVYPLSPHSFGESPGFELFFFVYLIYK